MTERLDPAAVNAATDIVQLVSRYAELKREGNEFSALCPFHHDTTPPGNLKVNPEKQVWACFACNAHQDTAADAIGFLMKAEGIDFVQSMRRLTNGSGTLPETKPARGRKLKKARPRENLPAPRGSLPELKRRDWGDPVHVATYRNAQGETLGLVARYKTPEGKSYRPWTWGRYSVEEAPTWECKQFSDPRPIYGLELLAARPGAQVGITEGEKACEAARILLPGLVWVTWPGGAQSAGGADWTPLTGRRVILWPDADEVGRQCMDRLAATLIGIALETKGLDTSEQPNGWDAADALDAGWTPEQTLAWALAHRTVYPTIAPPDAPPPGVVVAAPQENLTPLSEMTAQDAPGAAQAQVDTQTPTLPPASQAREPRKPGEPRKTSQLRRFGVVDGNVVRVQQHRQEIESDPEQLPAFCEPALADRFMAEEGERWRYCDAWRRWFHWTGERWKPDETRQIVWDVKNVCRAVAREHRDANSSQLIKMSSLRTIHAVREMAACYPAIATRADHWNANPWLIGLPDGGHVDLVTGKACAPDKGEFISKVVAVMPDEGPTPLFDAILSHAAKGDDSIVQYLWRWFGYFLTGDTREQALLFLYGPGASGKTTLIRTLAEILGDYRRNVPMEAFIAKDHAEHPTEIAMLAGARLVTATEPDSGARWNEGRIKALTGGEVITARVMRGDPFEFKPSWKIIIGGNHKPSLRSVGEEFKRRFHFILTETIPAEERIIDLSEKLRVEYPAILARMIRGCLDWQAYGLGRPEAIEMAVAEYLDAQDTFGEWLDARTEQRQDSITPSAELFRNYSDWAKEAGYYVPARNVFSGWLDDRGYARVKVANVRSFRGISLKPTGFAAPA